MEVQHSDLLLIRGHLFVAVACDEEGVTVHGLTDEARRFGTWFLLQEVTARWPAAQVSEAPRRA